MRTQCVFDLQGVRGGRDQPRKPSSVCVSEEKGPRDLIMNSVLDATPSDSSSTPRTTSALTCADLDRRGPADRRIHARLKGLLTRSLSGLSVGRRHDCLKGAPGVASPGGDGLTATLDPAAPPPRFRFGGSGQRTGYMMWPRSSSCRAHEKAPGRSRGLGARRGRIVRQRAG
jgi:hypothetical protein